MKLGMPTIIEFNSIKENVEFAKSHNLQFVELNMDLPYCQYLNDLDSFDFEFTMHLSEELNLGCLNDSLRKAYLEEAIRQIKMGIEHHIKRFTIHIPTGVHFTLPDGKIYLNDRYSTIFQDYFEDSCEKLEEIARENDVLILFENTKIHSFTPLAINIVTEFEHLGFTLDLGHNMKDQDKAYPLLYPTGQIRHIHMHDYDGKSDHLPIGTGIIDFTKYQDLLNNNYVVIEVKQKEELELSIENIQKF